ncbi:MAG: hypothetical protein V3W44_04240 [Dehalococcoidales bacterium]
MDELVNVGWYSCARYHEDVTREYKRILIVMFRFVIGRINGVDFSSDTVPVFIGKADEVMDSLAFRVDEVPSRHDISEQRVKAILAQCSHDERRLLELRFVHNLTYKEIGAIYQKQSSSTIIKFQKLFERIRKRERGEPTRYLRTPLMTT